MQSDVTAKAGAFFNGSGTSRVEKLQKNASELISFSAAMRYGGYYCLQRTVVSNGGYSGSVASLIPVYTWDPTRGAPR